MTYDHEIKSSYSVTVKADDNNGGTATIDVTITVADVDDRRSSIRPQPPARSPKTRRRARTSATPVTATDPDTGDTPAYTLEG